MYGLYIHIPFCVRKCLYCDFYSEALETQSIANRLTSHEQHDNTEFLDALEVELQRLPSPFTPTTLFMGGGTPTELSDTDFSRLLDMIHQHVDIRQVKEWTCESNPGTLTQSKTRIMHQKGINRISLGVQSFDARNLEFLGRIHSAQEAIEGYHLLRDGGFTNLNLDIIYGIPGSTFKTHFEDAEKIITLDPEHTSFYCLTFEEGTPLTKLRDKGFVQEVHSEEERDQFEKIRSKFTQAGYKHYEISNYAKPHYECQHNLIYWSGKEYIGCGPSSHSHWGGVRYSNIPNLKKYCNRLLSDQSARHFEECLKPEAKARETLVIGLRRLEGVSRHEFKKQTGFDIDTLCGSHIEKFCEQGLLQQTHQKVQLTDEGLFVSDAIFSELI
ncbi:MAG: radical SAM family heme chaperone HemW [Kiritimatiellae bacterium]|nr:radical SAM family heme chaperone HemW [Kiritimatiellia bacterium]